MKKINLLALFCLFVVYVANSQVPALAWAKAFGGSGGDGGKSIAVDSYGYVYTVGYFVNTSDFDPGSAALSFTSAGGKDIFVTKLDANGNLVWARQIGGTGDEEATGVAIDSKGNVYVCGNFENTLDFDPNTGVNLLTSAGLSDVFVFKLGSNGTLTWAKTMGGNGADECNDIDLYDDYPYITGQFNGISDFDPDAGTFNMTSYLSDAFVVRLNPLGGLLWARQLGGSGNDVGLSLAVSKVGDVYTTGYFSATADFDPGTTTATLSPAGNDDVFISKLDGAGSYVWAKNVGGTGADRGYRIAINSSDHVFLTGFFNGTADFDPGITTSNFTSAGTGDVFTLHLNSSGGFVWAKQMGGVNDNVGHGIVADNASNVYQVGVFQASCDFDPGTPVFTLTASGPNDVFLTKLDVNGDLVWAGQVGGQGPDLGESIAVDAAGAVYATGVFFGTADFDPGAATNSLVSAGVADVFVMKFAGVSAGLRQTGNSAIKLRAFPNPCNDFITVETADEGNLKLYNSIGELILSKDVQAGKTTIDLREHARGVYVFKLNQGLVRLVLQD